jgi:hypothetical protein
MTTEPSAVPQRILRPDAPLPPPDLVAIEALIRRAIDQRRPELLSIIGHGEISIAIRWKTGDTECVMKRVPPFPNRAAADRYCQFVRTYTDDLRRIGIRCVSTELFALNRDDDSTVVYHCQPLLDVSLLADHVLRASEPNVSNPLMNAVIDAIVSVHAAGLPIDGQFANWYWFEGEVWQLDFSTPFVLDSNGEVCFDVTGFTLEYPAPVRKIVQKELMKIVTKFGEIVWTLEDVLTQLVRQGLDVWCEPATAYALSQHQLVISPTLARERCRAEAKFYPALLRLKRIQREWRQRTRRRYDTLLPASSTYHRQYP